MLVLGINGGFSYPHEDLPDMGPIPQHDSAAALLEDMRVIAAIEEERLNRIKHSHHAPLRSIKFCLDSHGVSLQDIDYLAYYGREEFVCTALKRHLASPHYQRGIEGQDGADTVDVRTYLRRIFWKDLRQDISPKKFRFITHHVAHAMSAFAQSGFNKSLVITFDWQGDYEAGRVCICKDGELETLCVIPLSKSIGQFYHATTLFLGFTFFDEGKVMGLASYGNAERYRKHFDYLYALKPNGDYELHPERLSLLSTVVPPRNSWETITQEHMDIAASLQETLEIIAFHVLTHYQSKTGLRNLCMAGGVALNCTLNGKIMQSGLFENVFIQPASHDAGCALGAALQVFYEERNRRRQVVVPRRLKHTYWGTDIGDARTVLRALECWEKFVSIEEVDDICSRAASLIVIGAVLGWVQGRSEFGPRALGNRSIVADPRPAGNKDIINALVKKREAFRPFAPAVLVESASNYFEIPPNCGELPFMTVAVKLKKDKDKILNAVTHVDGTARIQTVSRRTNPQFWNLIHAFELLTNVPVLLNTSFNRNAEPIVDSVTDAIICFLTTQLDYIIISNYLITKNVCDRERLLLDMIPSVAPHVRLIHERRTFLNSGFSNLYKIGFSSGIPGKQISRDVFEVLSRANDRDSLSKLLWEVNYLCGREQLLKELNVLWTQHILTLRPPS